MVKDKMWTKAAFIKQNFMSKQNCEQIKLVANKTGSKTYYVSTTNMVS